MPYRIAKRGGGYMVVKKDTGTPIHKTAHKTWKDAVAHLRAVKANVKD